MSGATSRAWKGLELRPGMRVRILTAEEAVAAGFSGPDVDGDYLSSNDECVLGRQLGRVYTLDYYDEVDECWRVLEDGDTSVCSYEIAEVLSAVPLSVQVAGILDKGQIELAPDEREPDAETLQRWRRELDAIRLGMQSGRSAGEQVHPLYPERARRDGEDK